MNTLSSAIESEYFKISKLIEKIPAKQLTTKSIELMEDKISITDLVAYQIGWGTLLINWYEMGIQGVKPQMPGEGFDSWDYQALARHFYKKYQYDSGKKQQEIFHDMVHRIIAIAVKESKLGRLDRIGVWDWCTLKSGKKWPLSKWIQVNTVAPYKRAVALIKKTFLTTAASARA